MKQSQGKAKLNYWRTLSKRLNFETLIKEKLLMGKTLGIKEIPLWSRLFWLNFYSLWESWCLQMSLPMLKSNWLWGMGQEEKGTTEAEMVGWHPLLDGYEFEQALGVGDEQGRLSNWTELNWMGTRHCSSTSVSWKTAPEPEVQNSYLFCCVCAPFCITTLPGSGCYEVKSCHLCKNLEQYVMSPPNALRELMGKV